MVVDHIPGTCPWCETKHPITREWNGVSLHGINVENPEYPNQLIGVEILCLKYDNQAN